MMPAHDSSDCSTCRSFLVTPRLPLVPGGSSRARGSRFLRFRACSYYPLRALRSRPSAWGVSDGLSCLALRSRMEQIPDRVRAIGADVDESD